MKREAELKSAFGEEMRARLPGFLVLLQATRGAPDRAVVGMGMTTWWEFKHGTPEFDSPGDQELMCMRLEAAGYCRYVIWQERDGVGHRTIVARPRSVHSRTEQGGIVPEAWCPGFDHRWLVDYIRRVHER